MKLKLVKALDSFFRSAITRQLMAYALLILLFFMASKTINSIINGYFLIDSESLRFFHPFFFVVITTIIVIFVLYKLILKKYQISFFLRHSIIVVSVFYLITRFTKYAKEWSYIAIQNYSIKYVDFIGLILLVCLATIFFMGLYKKFYKPKNSKDNNPFVSDDPIESEIDDKLGYEDRASLDSSHKRNSLLL